MRLRSGGAVSRAPRSAHQEAHRLHEQRANALEAPEPEMHRREPLEGVQQEGWWDAPTLQRQSRQGGGQVLEGAVQSHHSWNVGRDALQGDPEAR